MKKIFNILVLSCLVIGGAVLSSCTFTEKIVIEADGSGTYNMDMDMSKFMDFASSMKESSDDSSESEKIFEEVVDSVIYFSEVLEEKKDSIAKLPLAERLVLESLKDAKMKMYIDEQNSKMLMNFIYDFKSVNDLKEIQKQVSKAYSLSNNKENKSSSTPNNTSYAYTEKSFKRSVVASGLSKKEKADYDKSMEEMSMFFAGSTYNIEYHFPKKVKSTTAKNVTFSEDKKTLFISYPFEELLKDESVLDFEVKF